MHKTGKIKAGRLGHHLQVCAESQQTYATSCSLATLIALAADYGVPSDIDAIADVAQTCVLEPAAFLILRGFGSPEEPAEHDGYAVSISDSGIIVPLKPPRERGE